MFAQAAPASVEVPFVGCASDGQTGPVAAPTKAGQPIIVSARFAQSLAYYKAAGFIGVLAPREWHCFATYGSSGENLFVSPDPLDARLLLSSDWKGITGPAIEFSISLGGTSGRFEVAKIIARAFPDEQEFVRKVIAEGIEPASNFPSGPYPHQSFAYRSKTVAEYTTPATTAGFGTESALRPNTSPIHGVLILSGKDPDLLHLSIRLPEPAPDLTRAIIEQAERDAAISHP
jgi:hypothetical protein